MIRLILIVILCSSALVFGGCNQQQSNQEIDYNTTKKMVVDILQTEDGKKAISETIANDEMKEHLVIQSDVVKQSINEVLISDRGVNMWRNLFQDPTFTKGFADSMDDSHKQLLKQLMTDPEFQQSMIEILQNPEINQQMLQLLKSQQFREHLLKVVTETIESPSFQTQISDILLKVSEQQKNESDKKESGDDQ